LTRWRRRCHRFFGQGRPDDGLRSGREGFGITANAVLTLADAEGKVLRATTILKSADPLLAFTFATDGRYTVRVSELLLGASADHFYRLSIGAFPT